MSGSSDGGVPGGGGGGGWCWCWCCAVGSEVVLVVVVVVVEAEGGSSGGASDDVTAQTWPSAFAASSLSSLFQTFGLGANGTINHTTNHN